MRATYLLASCSLLVSVASSQTRIALRGPPVRAVYDLDTGRIEPAGGALAAGPDAPTVCFDATTDDDGFFDVLLYPAGQELFNWGVKSCGGSSFVDEVTIGFSSMAQPVSVGGPGGRLTLRIYAGSTGHGSPGSLVKSIQLSGLFSNPGPVVTPTMLTIELGSESFFLADGPIGWSYENPDGSTGPILVDFDPALGMENAYDVYSPGPATEASYVGTFTLGPGGASNDPNENAFWFQLAQDDVLANAIVVPAGANPDILRTPAGPIVGRTWLAFVDVSAVRSNGVTLVALATQALPGVTTAAGTLIVDPASFVTEVSVGVRDAHGFEIPLDPALLGMPLHAQGGYLEPGGALRLTNGLDLTIGSF
jgi:hypothetical protein